MPVSVSINAAERVRYVVFAGVVDDDDMAESYRMISTSDEDPSMNVIADTRAVERIAVTAQGLQRLATQRARDEPAAPARAAVVAPSDAVFGLGRMYQSYREAEGGSTRYLICRTMPEARRWLGLAGDESPGP